MYLTEKMEHEILKKLGDRLGLTTEDQAKRLAAHFGFNRNNSISDDISIDDIVQVGIEMFCCEEGADILQAIYGPGVKGSHEVKPIIIVEDMEQFQRMVDSGQLVKVPEPQLH